MDKMDDSRDSTFDINTLTIGELKSMSYAKLQTVAKSLNIKANMKSQKMLTAILEKIAPKFEDESSMMETSTTELQSTLSPERQRTIRRRTYELTPKPEESSEKPEEKVKEHDAENKPVVTRRRTYELTPNPKDSSKKHEENVKKHDAENVVTRQASGKKLQSKPDRVKVAANQRSQIPRRVAVVKRIPQTPNFKQIHQKAFEKMESVDEYVEKLQQKASAIKQYGMRSEKPSESSTQKRVKPAKSQTPRNVFKPIVLSTSKMNLNFGGNAHKPLQEPKQLRNRNVGQVSKGLNNSVFTFNAEDSSKPFSALERRKQYDVASSLRRKLQYKPHSGPMKPFSINTTLSQTTQGEESCGYHIKHISDKARENRRSMLSGVRRNKRLELQLGIRNIRP